MKVLDPTRIQGRLPVIVDGTGHLAFRRPHCEHCLVQRHATTTVYLHQVLEAKLLGPGGLTLSMASAFIENEQPEPVRSEQQIKQDCELKAFDRLAASLKADFPQTRLCIGGDNLFCCGTVLQICKDNDWSFLLVFKPGGTPALYAEFEQLAETVPGKPAGKRVGRGTVGCIAG